MKGIRDRKWPLEKSSMARVVGKQVLDEWAPPHSEYVRDRPHRSRLGPGASIPATCLLDFLNVTTISGRMRGRMNDWG